jgi:coenzyme F420 hydrogenase subunit beta
VAGVRAIDYPIALMCPKNFNYERLIGDELEEQRDIDEVGSMDVLHGKLMVDDREGNAFSRRTSRTSRRRPEGL